MINVCIEHFADHRRRSSQRSDFEKDPKALTINSESERKNRVSPGNRAIRAVGRQSGRGLVSTLPGDEHLG